MIDILISAIKILVLLGFLITIHELGHFVIAKLSKVKVNKFAIGFGPKIFEKKKKETEYSLRLIPLGGFVSLEGEDGNSEDKNSFSNVSIWKRIAIVLAGSIVNIVFALSIYFAISFAAGTFVSNEISEVLQDSTSLEAGIITGDKITSINNEKVSSKSDVDNIMKKQDGSEILVRVLRGEEELEFRYTPTEQKIATTGIYLDEQGKIILLDENSNADKAGLEANDIILKVNEVTVEGDASKIVTAIGESELDILNLEIDRNGEIKNFKVSLEYTSIYQLGVAFKYAEDNIVNRAINGGMETVVFVSSIGESLTELITGKASVEQMIGPVGISEVIAKTDGIIEFLEMMALISISLGVTNLLPIPALDGGKIVILIIESIRKKPMKPETEASIQMLGFVLLIGLSIYITFNDVARIF